MNDWKPCDCPRDLPQLAKAAVAFSKPPTTVGTNGKNALIRPDTPATMLPNDLPSPVKAVGATGARPLEHDVQTGPPSAFVAAPSSPPRASEVPFTSGDSFGSSAATNSSPLPSAGSTAGSSRFCHPSYTSLKVFHCRAKAAAAGDSFTTSAATP